MVFDRITIVGTSPSGGQGVADSSIHWVAMWCDRLVNSANLVFMRKPKIEEGISVHVVGHGSMVAML